MNLKEQNSETSLLQLAAQDRLYASAKRQIWLLYLASAVPFAALLLNPFFPWLNDNVLALLGLIGLLISQGMEQWTKNRIDKASRIQEEYDMNIYGKTLPNNEGLTGERVKRDEIITAAGEYRLPKERLPWYSEVIEQVLEPSVQVLLCQRENAMWDGQARSYVARMLQWIFWLLLGLTLVIGFFTKNEGASLTVMEWTLYIIVPASSLLLKTWQLQQSFHITGKERETLDSNILEEIETYKKNLQPIAPERLRLFQDKIYKTRLENCIVPDWLHNQLQKGLQPTAKKSTEMIVKEINQIA